jgi:ferrous iron transport protein B
MKMLSLVPLNKNDKLYPDVALVVTDVENLKRNLYPNKGRIPTILVINMADRMKFKRDYARYSVSNT